MEIRRYKHGEECAIWNVYFAATRESIARDYHPDLVERWAPRNQDMTEWADRLARKKPFVAALDGQIVGMAEIEEDGFIDYFYVHPQWQGRGIGKALLAAVELEAARFGVGLTYADVSITAKSFFLSQGFRITEAKANVILGHTAPKFRMEKMLSLPNQAMLRTAAEFPDLAEMIALHVPDKKSRRGGHAVAAASLPMMKQ